MIDKKVYDVKMSIRNVSFSAHADAKGIINLLRNIDPDEVIFVHGDKKKMEIFKPLVEEQLQRKVHMPPNHDPLTIDAGRRHRIKLKESPSITSGYLYSQNNAREFCLL